MINHCSCPSSSLRLAVHLSSGYHNHDFTSELTVYSILKEIYKLFTLTATLILQSKQFFTIRLTNCSNSAHSLPSTTNTSNYWHINSFFRIFIIIDSINASKVSLIFMTFMHHIKGLDLHIFIYSYKFHCVLELCLCANFFFVSLLAHHQVLKYCVKRPSSAIFS